MFKVPGFSRSSKLSKHWKLLKLSNPPRNDVTHAHSNSSASLIRYQIGITNECSGTVCPVDTVHLSIGSAEASRPLLVATGCNMLFEPPSNTLNVCSMYLTQYPTQYPTQYIYWKVYPNLRNLEASKWLSRSQGTSSVVLSQNF